MARKINLFLFRHALSAANLEKSVNMRLPDQRVPLADGFGSGLGAEGSDAAPYNRDEDGKWQARESGLKLAEMIAGDPRFHGRTRILCSPYLRTRQTAEGIKSAFDSKGIAYDVREEISLREISFGLFDGFSDEELKVEFPREHAHYQKHVEIEGEAGAKDGEFWAMMPMGESRAQVADRVKSGSFGTILRDADPAREDPVLNFVIVSHGVTIRTFIMQWMHHGFEWYGEQKNPWNASVNLIESDGGAYKHSVVIDGYHHERATAQDKREDGRIS